MMLKAVSLRCFGFVAAVMVGGTLVSNGATVFFNDANRGPSGSLDIGGVTASTSATVWTNGVGFSPLTTQTGTASGSGLGAVGLGPDNSFNLLFHYSAGDSSYDWMASEGGSLTLDNPNYMITSITLAPSVTATLGSLSPVSVQLPFTATVLPAYGGGPGTHEISSSGPATYTVSFYNGPDSPSFITSTLSLTSLLNGMSDGFPAAQYRQQNLSDDMTLDYGFTVVSLDYTMIPEPGTVSLLVLCLGSLFLARRKPASKN